MPESPVPQEVSVELRRVADRWSSLPVGHALVCMPRVHEALASLADLSWSSPGRPPQVPDLGPGVVIEQLRAMTFDASVCQCGAAGSPEEILAVLVGLRRAMAQDSRS